jgi:hypothetical protein
MRNMRSVVAVAAMAAVLPTAPAMVASPRASCPGQELSALAPVLGSDLGAFISFEARNPEVEGWRNFGAEIKVFAHADRAACPEE